jgi:hypothetical protein
MRELSSALAAEPALADLVRRDPAFQPLWDHPLFLMVLGDL